MGKLRIVEKTRKEHKCEVCGYVIPKGEKAQYCNLFTGKRGYRHYLSNVCNKNIDEKIEKRRRIKGVNG